MEAHQIWAVIAIALASFSLGMGTGRYMESLQNKRNDGNDQSDKPND